MQFIEVIPDTLKLSNNYWWKLHRSVQFLAATLHVHVAYVGEVQLYMPVESHECCVCSSSCKPPPRSRIWGALDTFKKILIMHGQYTR